MNSIGIDFTLLPYYPVVGRDEVIRFVGCCMHGGSTKRALKARLYVSPWQRHGLKRCPNVNLRPERAIYLFSTICCPFRAQICRAHFLPMALPWAIIFMAFSHNPNSSSFCLLFEYFNGSLGMTECFALHGGGKRGGSKGRTIC